MSHLIPPSLDEADVSMPLEAPRWYAVYTQLRQEKRAALAIGDALRDRDPWRDLAVYLPCETRWVRHARKKEIRSSPIFGRHVFVLIREEHMHLVKDADGVVDFLRSGGKPQVMSRHGVRRLNEIREAEEAGDYDFTRGETFDGPFTEGDRIEVALGKMSGWPGTVLRMTAENRVRVLLSMFGKEHEKELDVNEVRAA